MNDPYLSATLLRLGVALAALAFVLALIAIALR